MSKNESSTTPRKPSIRIPLLIFTFLVTLVIIGGFAGYFWYNHEVNTPASDNVSILTVKVVSGQTLVDIVPQIQGAGGLRSSLALKVYIRLNNIDIPLVVGTYQIPLDKNIPDLLAALSGGPKLNSVSVTIKEGLRQDEIADLLDNAFKTVPSPQFDRSEFLSICQHPDGYSFKGEIATFLQAYKPEGKPLEGFLFPDTYNIGVDATAINVVELLLGNFITRLAENNINPSAQSPVGSLYSTLTLASVVQRESFGLDEARMVADIFIKRLNQGMVLGSDATILYPYKRWQPEPDQSELATDTPYNSRIHAGLIPTPICNPGIDAIKAVESPTLNDYYYFLHDKDNVIRYARTLAEHQYNAWMYL